MSLTYNLTSSSVTVLGDDFVPKVMPASHPAFAQVVSALKAGNDNQVKQLMDLPSAIASFMQGKVQIVDRTLFYDGKPLHNSLTIRILQFMEAGDKELAQPLINFLEKVKENPSRRAVEGLYDWCVQSGLPITPEGDVIAYKIVTDDYRDIYTKTFDNSIGQTVSVSRNEVDEDPDRTCSYGLHVCGTKYLPHYGTATGGGSDRVMVVKVHPKDFVAIPRDYNCSKARVCEYRVVGQVPGDKAKDFFPSYVSNYSYDPGPAGELDDELEVGNYYRTRDGRVVEIVAFEDDENEEYPYTGVVLPSRGEQQIYTPYGSWTGNSQEHPLDLVENLGFDYELEQAEEEAEKPKGLIALFLDAFLGPRS